MSLTIKNGIKFRLMAEVKVCSYDAKQIDITRWQPIWVPSQVQTDEPFMLQV